MMISDASKRRPGPDGAENAKKLTDTLYGLKNESLIRT